MREQEKTILDKRSDLSPEAYAQERSEYEARLIEARKVAQSKKRRLEEASGKAMDTLREQLYLVVQSIANEQGYALVISNKNVIAGEKSLDITEETMKRLNEAVAENSFGDKGGVGMADPKFFTKARSLRSLK